jgi:dienelactone hydrolase
MFFSSRFRWLVVLSLSTYCLWTATEGRGDATVDAFDGSFRLESGEIVTGGYFVEAGRARYLFMDTEGLDKVGLFEPVTGNVLRSTGMLSPVSVEIEFFADADGSFDTLEWREAGQNSIRGERVYPHRSQEVEFTSADGTRLWGRLLLPGCPGPHPVVVYVHGSGPVNRYGGTFHTFFLQRGVAVLAYDKRGYVPDPDAWREPDLATLSADVAAAVRLVADRSEIDRNRIGLFATSQGGWVAPPAAALAPEVDYLLVRVGPATTVAETILHEIRQEGRAKGLTGLDLDYAMDLRREIYDLASRGATIAAADAVAEPYLDEPWYRTAFGEKPVSALWSQSWWQWLHRNHGVTPVPALTEFEGPVLWFLAEADENVPLVPTRAALERAFVAAPGDDHEIVIIRDAPHSFIISGPDGRPRYAHGFFNEMADWMADHAYSDPGCEDRAHERLHGRGLRDDETLDPGLLCPAPIYPVAIEMP